LPRPQAGGKTPGGTKVRSVNKVPGTIQATAPRFTKPGGALGTELAIARAVRAVSPSDKSARHIQSAYAKWRDEDDDDNGWQPYRQVERQDFRFRQAGGRQLEFEDLTPDAQRGVAFLQGLILDAAFDVDLTGDNSGQLMGWAAWINQPDRINSAYQAILRNAGLYNRIAEQNDFSLPNSTWLFRNLSGPIEMRLVASLEGNLYGQTSTMQAGTITQIPGQDSITQWTWGAVRNAIQRGATIVSNDGDAFSTLIRLTDQAFIPDTVNPRDFYGNETRYNLAFGDDFIIDHEIGHIAHSNWGLSTGQMGARFYQIMGEMGLDIQNLEEIAMPNIGARSILVDYEYWPTGRRNSCKTIPRTLTT
jgi:hypothetical protein